MLAASFEPFYREILIGVGEFGSGLARKGALAMVSVCFPGNASELIDLASRSIKGGILEPLFPTTLKLLAGQLRRPLALAHVRRGVKIFRSLHSFINE